MSAPASFVGRILITNHALVQRAGTELVTRDLAIGLQRRGWQPTVYSPVLGDVADDVRRAGVAVVDAISAVSDPPAVIHGHHHLPAMTAMLQFPSVPAVFVCHGWTPPEERPPAFPSIRRYVAVDDLCRERVLATPEVSEGDVRTIYNAVDLGRFIRRGPLPPRPRRALVFSNYATGVNFATVIREACQRSGITHVDVAGAGVGHSVAAPETLLPAYDLVFAKARCALEALAVGTAVIVVDAGGLAGMVTPQNVAAWRRLNFGFRTLRPEALNVEAVAAEVARYDPDRSAEVTQWIRQEADTERALDAYEALYREVLREAQDGERTDATPATAAASVYLEQLASEAHARAVRDAVEAERSARLADALIEVRRSHAAAEDRAVAMEQESAQLRRTLTDIESSRTWRALGPYRRLRGWLAGRR